MPRTEVSSSGMTKKDVVREKTKKRTPIFSGEKGELWLEVIPVSL